MANQSFSVTKKGLKKAACSVLNVIEKKNQFGITWQLGYFNCFFYN